MNIKVKITKVFDNNRTLKALADVVIDNSVVIHGVGVCENEKGRFMTMPMSSWTDKEGKTQKRAVCHPISSPARKEIEDALYGAYEVTKLEKNGGEENVQ